MAAATRPERNTRRRGQHVSALRPLGAPDSTPSSTLEPDALHGAGGIAVARTRKRNHAQTAQEGNDTPREAPPPPPQQQQQHPSATTSTQKQKQRQKRTTTTATQQQQDALENSPAANGLDMAPSDDDAAASAVCIYRKPANKSAKTTLHACAARANKQKVLIGAQGDGVLLVDTVTRSVEATWALAAQNDENWSFVAPPVYHAAERRVYALVRFETSSKEELAAWPAEDSHSSATARPTRVALPPGHRAVALYALHAGGVAVTRDDGALLWCSSTGVHAVTETDGSNGGDGALRSISEVRHCRDARRVRGRLAHLQDVDADDDGASLYDVVLVRERRCVLCGFQVRMSADGKKWTVRETGRVAMDNAALDASGEGREDVASVALIPKSAKLALLWSSGRLDVYEQNGERVAHAYSTHDACKPTASPTVNVAAAAPAPATPARSRSRGKKAAVEPAAQLGASTSSLPRIDVPPSGEYVAILSSSDKDTGVMSYSILESEYGTVVMSGTFANASAVHVLDEDGVVMLSAGDAVHLLDLPSAASSFATVIGSASGGGGGSRSLTIMRAAWNPASLNEAIAAMRGTSAGEDNGMVGMTQATSIDSVLRWEEKKKKGVSQKLSKDMAPEKLCESIVRLLDSTGDGSTDQAMIAADVTALIQLSHDARVLEQMARTLTASSAELILGIVVDVVERHANDDKTANLPPLANALGWMSAVLNAHFVSFSLSPAALEMAQRASTKVSHEIAKANSLASLDGLLSHVLGGQALPPPFGTTDETYTVELFELV
ncbi:hypothetical protein PPROV_000327300 [Pycnococcus provasolii]|uniref:Uncharacterized protein n=2 Tax=Pycnococcus provasolii TaxID=41880 RepID=A0A830HGS8_9CHLO|nr:hypothetical protein PPROV_000327300 [Pycnococcus provasolii]